MSDTFQDFIGRERGRLQHDRDQLMLQRSGLDEKIAEIDREFSAIGAYEAAKAGRTSAPVSSGTARRARRGSRREEIVAVIRDSNGLSRGELLEKMGLKNNKQGEMSVSNALTALTKAGTVQRADGKYMVAA
ncbi:MAG TPA: hypothetical protein VHY35_10590 [Stellaceae bacterium]|jgi:hypothetical protein|nr:hypothetical protein [Stellaceae bacterium]